MDALLSPFWEGDVMTNESLLPVRGEDGSAALMPLLYHADEILSVRSATLETAYQPGRDYTLENGSLRLPEGTAIPVMDWDDYYPPEEEKGRCFPHSAGGWIRFGEGAYFHRRQIVVSYRHADAWRGAVPARKLDRLPKTAKRLREGAPLRLLIFGDSISTGVNASGVTGAPPFQKPWYDLTVDGLAGFYGTRGICLLNTSVGGKTSDWGRETARENGAAQRPDLCVLGFGMNDGSGRMPPETFIDNLRAIMAAVSAENPGCEFVLIATTLANREVRGFLGCQADYLAPMLALEREGVAVADMTTFHRDLLRRKPFRDMTGNNVNHPNDFLSRAYAQVMLRTLGALGG
ncbi:MAG: SGNH/GDSL hydrolase family protein [Clostridia bacterium]|nr:SGNH/GDSL hydrolase family protein [Clostridia bacterium]